MKGPREAKRDFSAGDLEVSCDLRAKEDEEGEMDRVKMDGDKEKSGVPDKNVTGSRTQRQYVPGGAIVPGMRPLEIMPPPRRPVPQKLSYTELADIAREKFEKHVYERTGIKEFESWNVLMWVSPKYLPGWQWKFAKGAKLQSLPTGFSFKQWTYENLVITLRALEDGDLKLCRKHDWEDKSRALNAGRAASAPPLILRKQKTTAQESTTKSKPEAMAKRRTMRKPKPKANNTAPMVDKLLPTESQNVAESKDHTLASKRPAEELVSHGSTKKSRSDIHRNIDRASPSRSMRGDPQATLPSPPKTSPIRRVDPASVSMPTKTSKASNKEAIPDKPALCGGIGRKDVIFEDLGYSSSGGSGRDSPANLHLRLGCGTANILSEHNPSNMEHAQSQSPGTENPPSRPSTVQASNSHPLISSRKRNCRGESLMSYAPSERLPDYQRESPIKLRNRGHTSYTESTEESAEETSSDEEDIREDGEYYDVAEVIGERLPARTGETLKYFIRWTDFKKCSWVAARDCACPKLIYQWQNRANVRGISPSNSVQYFGFKRLSKGPRQVARFSRERSTRSLTTTIGSQSFVWSGRSETIASRMECLPSVEEDDAEREIGPEAHCKSTAQVVLPSRLGPGRSISYVEEESILVLETDSESGSESSDVDDTDSKTDKPFPKDSFSRYQKPLLIDLTGDDNDLHGDIATKDGDLETQGIEIVADVTKSAKTDLSIANYISPTTDGKSKEHAPDGLPNQSRERPSNLHMLQQESQEKDLLLVKALNGLGQSSVRKACGVVELSQNTTDPAKLLQLTKLNERAGLLAPIADLDLETRDKHVEAPLSEILNFELSSRKVPTAGKSAQPHSTKQKEKTGKQKAGHKGLLASYDSEHVRPSVSNNDKDQIIKSSRRQGNDFGINSSCLADTASQSRRNEANNGYHSNMNNSRSKNAYTYPLTKMQSDLPTRTIPPHLENKRYPSPPTLRGSGPHNSEYNANNRSFRQTQHVNSQYNQPRGSSRDPRRRRGFDRRRASTKPTGLHHQPSIPTGPRLHAPHKYREQVGLQQNDMNPQPQNQFSVPVLQRLAVRDAFDFAQELHKGGKWH